MVIDMSKVSESDKWKLWWVVIEATKISFDDFVAMSAEARMKLIEYVAPREVERIMKV